MSLQSVERLSFEFCPSRPVEIEVSRSPLSSDAGLLAIREFDERLGLTAQFAAALQDTRDPTFTQHSLLTMVRQRIYGIIADYEDQNDHDTLRSDPFQTTADVCRMVTIWPAADAVPVRERGDDCRPVATAGRLCGSVYRGLR
jgi:hypothetical protein